MVTSSFQVMDPSAMASSAAFFCSSEEKNRRTSLRSRATLQSVGS